MLKNMNILMQRGDEHNVHLKAERKSETDEHCHPNVLYSNRCVIFRKTHEAFGGLSNMATGYNIRLTVEDSEYVFPTSENLYQVCRFPCDAEVQKLIACESNPMAAKMKSKKYRKELTRKDWDEVRDAIMWWCLRLKLACNYSKFGALLDSTGNRTIVEDSRCDRYWGAVRDKENPDILRGQNRLGYMLVQLRDLYRNTADAAEIENIQTPDIPDFRFFGQILNNNNKHK
jgi:type I restriction enzyme S subunit